MEIQDSSEQRGTNTNKNYIDESNTNSILSELLKMVDEGVIKFNPAVELSFLKKEEQGQLLRCI